MCGQGNLNLLKTILIKVYLDVMSSAFSTNVPSALSTCSQLVKEKLCFKKLHVDTAFICWAEALSINEKLFQIVCSYRNYPYSPHRRVIVLHPLTHPPSGNYSVLRKVPRIYFPIQLIISPVQYFKFSSCLFEIFFPQSVLFIQCIILSQCKAK